MANLRAIIINIISPQADREQSEKECAELARLLHTLRGIVVVKVLQKRGRPSAKMFLGTGKADEVAALVQELNIDVVVANSPLKPTQINNLNKVIPCEVWDRTDVILKIFERHAVSQESKWQVALAQYKNEFPRLYGKGIEMSQIVGGQKGYTRGPGEKLLEQRKRHFRARIDQLEKKIQQLQVVNRTQREVRKRKNLLHLALVGYTNSGKSSLLVALTNKKNIYIADELFATLDTRIGSLYLPGLQQKVLISDTIGFIQQLPPHLISSFLTTLQDVREADILLHIIDSAEENILHKVHVVRTILTELHCDHKPVLYIFNKTDLLNSAQQRALKRNFKDLQPILLSAKDRDGLDKLKQEIEKRCNQFSPYLY